MDRQNNNEGQEVHGNWAMCACFVYVDFLALRDKFAAKKYCEK